MTVTGYWIPELGCHLCLWVYMCFPPKYRPQSISPWRQALHVPQSQGSIFLLFLPCLETPTDCLGTPHFHAPPLNNHPSLLISLITGSSPLGRINDFRIWSSILVYPLFPFKHVSNYSMNILMSFFPCQICEIHKYRCQVQSPGSSRGVWDRFISGVVFYSGSPHLRPKTHTNDKSSLLFLVKANPFHRMWLRSPSSRWGPRGLSPGEPVHLWLWAVGSGASCDPGNLHLKTVSPDIKCSLQPFEDGSFSLAFWEERETGTDLNKIVNSGKFVFHTLLSELLPHI